MSDTERLTKAFSEALDACTNPADDWVSVGRGFLAEAIDHMDWLEKGNAEWRDSALTKARHLAAVQATARIAIGHLQRVLQDTHARIPSEQRLQWRRDAEDWLASIGSEPS